MNSMNYKLTSNQRSWLLNVINHPHKEYWVDKQKEEEEDILKILRAGEYDEAQRFFLTEFVDYYVAKIEICGTLKNTITEF